MDHIVSVGMDAGTLKQLDDLRRAHPNVPSRVDIIKRLIWEAHAKIAAPAQRPPAPTDNALGERDRRIVPPALAS